MKSKRFLLIVLFAGIVIIIGKKMAVNIDFELNKKEESQQIYGDYNCTIKVKGDLSIFEEWIEGNFDCAVKGKIEEIGYLNVHFNGVRIGQLEAHEDVIYVEKIEKAHVMGEKEEIRGRYYMGLNSEVREKVDIDDAWRTTRGSPNVTIAVLDSGVDSRHPSLYGRILQGWNFCEDSSNTNDSLGHGTSIAGIVAGSSSDPEYSGMAPDCRILPVKVTDMTGITDYFILSQWQRGQSLNIQNLLSGPQFYGESFSSFFLIFTSLLPFISPAFFTSMET